MSLDISPFLLDEIPALTNSAIDFIRNIESEDPDKAVSGFTDQSMQGCYR